MQMYRFNNTFICTNMSSTILTELDDSFFIDDKIILILMLIINNCNKKDQEIKNK